MAKWRRLQILLDEEDPIDSQILDKIEALLAQKRFAGHARQALAQSFGIQTSNAQIAMLRPPDYEMPTAKRMQSQPAEHTPSRKPESGKSSQAAALNFLNSF